MSEGAAHLPGGSNGYAPGTADLVVGFSRNRAKYAYTNYVQIIDIPNEKDTVRYPKFNRSEAVRMVGGKTDQYNWPYGNERPNNQNRGEFRKYIRVKTKRQSFDYQGDTDSLDMADLPEREISREEAASKAITARVARIHEVLETNSNWNSNHRADVTAISGISGRWDVATTSNKDIQKSIHHAWRTIELATNAAIDYSDFMLVMNTTTANKIATSQEHINSVIQSTDGLKQFTGMGYKPYGLQNQLYGLPVFVENAVYDTSARSLSNPDAESKSYICSDNVVYMLARPGKLSMNISEGRSFSSLGLFMKEDMTDESDTDTFNRIEKGAITDNCVPKLITSEAAFRFDNVCA